MAILITLHSLEEKAAADPQDPKVNRELGKNEAREAARRNVRLNDAPVPKDAPNGVLDIEGTRPPPLEIYAYKSHCQPYRAWLGVFATSAIIIFSGATLKVIEKLSSTSTKPLDSTLAMPWFTPSVLE